MQKKNIRKFFIIVLMLFLFFPKIQINAQSSNLLKLQDSLEQKLAKSKSGTVRVIVQLDEQFTPEGQLSKNKKDTQKNKIKEAQEIVLEDLNKKSSDTSKHISNFKTIPYMALEVDSEGLQALNENKKVKRIMEDEIISKSTLNENELSSKLSQTNNVMNTEKAWSAGFTGQGKTIAILDTGVDKNHPFLQNKVVYEGCFSSTGHCSGYTELTGPGSADDTEGHGTHVAGIAAGNGTEFSGIAKNANIIAIKVLADEGSGTFSDVLKGLEQVYSLSSQFDISAINLSLGGGSYSSTCDIEYPSMKNIIDNLKSVGIATIAASGNEYYKSSMGVPACISSVISVGATNDSDAVASFSNSASFLDLLAPGNPVYSSVPGGGFAFKSGTSMATPQVAGGFTLVKQSYPNFTVDQIVSLIQQNGVNITDPANSITTPRLDFSWMASTLPSLGQVQKPIWHGDTIQWAEATNTSQYEVKLYKESNIINTQQVDASVLQVNYASLMTSPGIYRITVQAIGDNINYRDGQPSLSSEENRKGNVYYENFENGNGSFTTSGNNSSWQWGTPITSPNSAYSGTKVWATNLNGNYQNYESSYIVSPNINLSNFGSPITLSWMQYALTESNYDFINVEVSKDGGQTWNRVYHNHGTINQYWGKQQITIDDSYAVPNFKVRFGLDSDESVTFSGISIDDFMISSPIPLPSLEQIQKPIWNGDVIQWSPVANASQYELKLYRGTTLVHTQKVAASVRQYNYASKLTASGAYTISVQAIGDNINYRNGAVSSRSNQKITLNSVPKPTWKTDVIQWSGVANASQYELKLYRGTTLIHTQRVAATVRQYNFASKMATSGAYTVTVQAVGNNVNYRSGTVSSRSNQKITLNRVSKPTWYSKAIKWSGVSKASQYELKLYRGTTLVHTQKVAASVRQYNYASKMTTSGLYTVSVRAIGDNKTYRNGPFSERSGQKRK